MSSFITMSTRKFLSKLLLYLVLSLVLFTFTSGGWTSLIYLYLGGAVAIVIFTISVFATFVWQRTKGIRTLAINTRLLYATGISQLFALLFNYADHGDSGGAYTFFDRLLSTPSSVRGASQLTIFSLPLLLLYLVLFLGTIFFAFSKSAKTSSIQSWSRGSLLGGVIGAAASIFLLVLVYLSELSVFNSIILAIFIAPLFVVGVLVGKLVKLVAISKSIAVLLIIILLPLMAYAGVVFREQRMNREFNTLPEYPGAVQIYKQIRSSNKKGPEDIAYYPVVTAFYESSASADDIKKFFDQEFHSADLPPHFGWGTNPDLSGSSRIDKLIREKKDIKLYYLDHKVLVHVIEKPEDASPEIRDQLQPGKQYYEIQLYFH